MRGRDGYLERTNMVDCKLKTLVVLLAGIVGSTVAQAQTKTAVYLTIFICKKQSTSVP